MKSKLLVIGTTVIRKLANGDAIREQQEVVGYYVYDERYDKHYIYSVVLLDKAICKTLSNFEVEADSVKLINP